MPSKREKKDNLPRKKSDELLKGATEENIPELLRFLYPNADELFDFDRGYEVLDKELHAIVPDRGARVARVRQTSW